ncbi:MAG: tyrosine-type recombinase/integrase [Ignavibacteriales bacterium]|nr:tyrosine-type recombinase/integrase [Ignavibacteriales bacterium]
MQESEIKYLIEEFLLEYLNIKQASENTIVAYRNDLKKFSEFCEIKGRRNISEVTEKDIRHFLMRLNENNLSKKSISRKLSALRSFYDFLIRNELTNRNATKQISNPKLERKLPDVIDYETFIKIYRLLEEEKDFKEALKKKTIFEILYGCALRVSELCDLNFIDVDTTGQTIKVFGKGSKVRIVPIGNKSKEVINEYLENFQHTLNNSPFFTTKKGDRIYPRLVQRIVNKYLSKVSDIKKKSPHIFRHSAATHMLNSGADLMAIKEILGHENLSTTQIYTHISIEQLKKAYKQAHPKS